jgi:hypothetical protein
LSGRRVERAESHWQERESKRPAGARRDPEGYELLFWSGIGIGQVKRRTNT